MALRLLARAWKSWGILALANQQRPDKTVSILGCIPLFCLRGVGFQTPAPRVMKHQPNKSPLSSDPFIEVARFAAKKGIVLHT